MNNNIIDIVGIKAKNINLFPSNIVEEIIQNIRLILTTIVGTVPLDRSFGLTAEFIDDPHPRAMMRFAIYAVESIQEYEPRAEVREIEFVPDPENALDGRLYPKVSVRILDEYLSG